jgi:HEAT repeat protein
VEAITEALDDEDYLIRQAACKSLSEIGDLSAIPLFIQRLEDASPTVRAAAKVALSVLGDNSTEKDFWNDLQSSDPTLKASSIVALAELKNFDILPVALKEIASPDSQTLVKVASARALAILKPEIYNLVLQSLNKTEKGSLLKEALSVNYKYEGKDLLALITESLSDQSSPMHNDAASILRELKEEVALPALRRALAECDAYVVANAAYALGELNDKKSVDALIDVCKRYGF